MKSSHDYFSYFSYNFIIHMFQIFITTIKTNKDKNILSKAQTKKEKYFSNKKLT